jgi:PAS domain S-box-containing protein
MRTTPSELGTAEGDQFKGEKDDLPSLASVPQPQSKDHYRTVAELTSDFAYAIRVLEGGEIEMEWTTGGFEDVTGLPPEEANAFGLLNLVHPEDLPMVQEGLERLLSGEEVRLSYRIVRPDDDVRWLQTVARPEVDEGGRVSRLWGAGNDVTRLRENQDRMERTEEALRESEARYQQLIEQVPAVVYIAEPGETGEWLYVSPQIERILGFPPEDWVADPSLWARQLHPDDRDRVLLAEEDARRATERGAAPAGDLPAVRTEYRMLASDGRVVWVSDEAYFFPTAPGGPGLFRGVMADITDRKRAEEALSRSEDRYRSLFHGVPIGLYRTDPEGEILDANQTLADILGHPDVESLKVARAEEFYVDPEERHRWKDLLEANDKVIDFEMVHRRPDGQQIWVRDSARAVRDQDGRVVHYEGTVEDITQRKRATDELEEGLARLRKSDDERRILLSRLVEAQEEERRRIAGEIHDDSVQVMAAVGLRLEVLEGKLKGHEATGSVLPELRRDVRTAVQRLRRLIFDLRPLALDRDGVAAALRLYLERFSSDPETEYRLEDRLIVEPPEHIRMSLYRIAQEAIVNASKHARARRVTVLLDSIGETVILRVTDDGAGFTPGQGDGPAPGHLGLSAMREQAEMVGGELSLRSGPGQGTKVEARIPVPEAEPYA